MRKFILKILRLSVHLIIKYKLLKITIFPLTVPEFIPNPYYISALTIMHGPKFFQLLQNLSKNQNFWF